MGDVGLKLETHVPDRDAREYFILLISRANVAQIRRESHHRQDLLRLFQVVCPILAGGRAPLLLSSAEATGLSSTLRCSPTVPSF